MSSGSFIAALLLMGFGRNERPERITGNQKLPTPHPGGKGDYERWISALVTMAEVLSFGIPGHAPEC